MFGLGRVINKEGVEWKCVGEDEVADVVASDGEGVEGCGVAVAHGHFDGLEEGVHLHVDACRWVREIQVRGSVETDR